MQVPTTLLAQVDSSVGGKTAINSPQGKNLIGAFHQPRLVLADTALLDTLPERDFLAGYAEVAKYGLLGDADFFAWLEVNAPSLRAGDPDARQHAVRRSCEMKAAVVARDETERGDRALLNLGHTFGHALEAATGYSDRLLHGEAVSIGCVLAFELSARLGLCAQEAPSRVGGALRGDGDAAAGSATSPATLPGPESLVELMGQDKKVRDGRIAFVLARGIGEAFVARDVDARRGPDAAGGGACGPRAGLSESGRCNLSDSGRKISRSLATPSRGRYRLLTGEDHAGVVPLADVRGPEAADDAIRRVPLPRPLASRCARDAGCASRRCRPRRRRPRALTPPAPAEPSVPLPPATPVGPTQPGLLDPPAARSTGRTPTWW